MFIDDDWHKALREAESKEVDFFCEGDELGAFTDTDRLGVLFDDDRYGVLTDVESEEVSSLPE